jgi:hypothetical protein
MPHVLIYSHYNNLGKGPTYVANNDQLLLDYLGAVPPNSSHQDSMVNESPTVVLDKLEQRGYRVVGMSANANTQFNSYVWTLHKPEEIEPFG